MDCRTRPHLLFLHDMSLPVSVKLATSFPKSTRRGSRSETMRPSSRANELFPQPGLPTSSIGRKEIALLFLSLVLTREARK